MAQPARENRKNKRVSFSASEGLFAVIELPVEKQPLTMCIEDISSSGVRLSSLSGETMPTVAQDDTLALKEIIGTASLSFQSPLELKIRWITKRPGRKKITLGGELFPSTEKDRKTLADFVKGEMRWKIIEPRAEKEDHATSGSAAGVELKALPRRTAEAPSQPVPAKTWFWQITAPIGLILVIMATLGQWQVNRLGQRLEEIQRIVSARSRMPAIPKATGRRPEKKPPKVNRRMEAMLDRMENLGQRLEDISRRIDRLEKLVSGPPAKAAQSASLPGEEKSSLTGSSNSPVAAMAPFAPETSSGSSPPVISQDPGSTFHTVKKGENLFRIALRHHTTVEELLRINNLQPQDPIYPGQKIKLP